MAALGVSSPALALELPGNAPQTCGEPAGNSPIEPIIEPGLPIVDAHHHLWLMRPADLAQLQRMDSAFDHALMPVYRRNARYLLDEYLVDVNGGHNIRASVFMEAYAMYRVHGPPQLRSTGEVEFANGVAAMSASGAFGPVQVCAGIVGSGAALSLGDGVEPVLRAHIRAGGGRYRGVRAEIAHDADRRVLGRDVPYVAVDEKFRVGLRWLQKLGLSFDVWALEPQLPEVIELARAFPETQIIVNHSGTPIGVGRFAGQRQARFPIWHSNMRALAACENVVVKLGGLGLPLCGFESFMANPPASSATLANEWRPYVHTCIEAFGTHRCMFESDFPVDAGTCSYAVLWNAFKRLAAGASQREKTALFSGTATRVYRLDVNPDMSA